MTTDEEGIAFRRTRIAPPPSALWAWDPRLSVFEPPIQRAALHHEEETVADPDTETETHPRIEDKQLQGYNRALRDIIMQAVNRDGIRYRSGASKTILYPPDGTQQRTVYCRDDDRQTRGLQHWYIEHVHLVLHPEDRALIEEPEGHPLASVPDLADLWVEPEELNGGGSVTEPEWVQHYGDDGTPVEGFVTNGAQFKCTICEDQGKQYVSNQRTGIGGHRRTHVASHANAYAPESQAKRVDSMRYNKLAARIRTAVDELARSIDYAPAPDRLAVLEQENAALKHEVADLKAKLALLREALDA